MLIGYIRVPSNDERQSVALQHEALNALFLSVTGCLIPAYVADRMPSSTKVKRHALARAIFLHQLGELCNRAAEAIAYRASGLNLVVNAIVLWNTVYLSRAVDYVRSKGIIILEELLSSVAPLPLGHISLTGDYLWNEIDRPLERYRPVRTKRFNPKNFIFP